MLARGWCSVRAVALLLAAAVFLAASKGRAQDPASGPAVPRKAPRLEYRRGPAECLPEIEFRREVAIAGDGVDRFDATGDDVLRVRFERTAKGYRGTIDFTAADGPGRKSKVQEHANCEILGRWVGTAAAFYFPPRPEPVAPPKPADPAPSKGPAEWVPPLLPPQRFEPSSPQSLPSSSFWDAVKSMDLTIGLSAYALMTVGLTANVGPGFGIGADARGEVFSFGLELRGVLPGTIYAAAPLDPSKSHATVSSDLSQLTALLVPCLRYSYLLGCGVAQGGVFLYTNQDAPLGTLPVPSGVGLGSKEAVFTVDKPGTCAQSGGAASGELHPAGPVTFCCQPPAGPAE